MKSIKLILTSSFVILVFGVPLTLNFLIHYHGELICAFPNINTTNYPILFNNLLPHGMLEMPPACYNFKNGQQYLYTYVVTLNDAIKLNAIIIFLLATFLAFICSLLLFLMITFEK